MMMVVLCVALLVAATNLVDAKSISLENEQAEPTTLFWLSDDQLYRMTIDTSVHTNPKMVLTSDSVMDYDFDAEQKKLFWLDQNGKIFAQSIDGKSSDKLVFQSKMFNPKARITYDFVTNKFYEMEKKFLGLYVIDARNQIQETLIYAWPQSPIKILSNGSKYIRIEKPVNLVLDPLSGLIFISTTLFRYDYSQIYRVNMDGTIKGCIVPYAGSDELAVDIDNKRIYWPDVHKNGLKSSDYNGDKLVSVVHFNNSNLVSFAVHNNRLYWFVYEYDFPRSSTGTPKSRLLLKFCKIVEDKCDESSIHQIKLNLDSYPRSLKILRTSDAQRKFTNPCEPDNGSCQHLCLLTGEPGRKKCKCNDGWQPVEDDKSCRPIGETFANRNLQEPPADGRSKRQVTWDMYSQQPTLRPDPQLPQQPNHIPIYIFYPGK